MSEILSVFRSPEGQAQYHAAYQAVLKEWPVPYEEFFTATCLGDTHVIASGPQEAAPVMLLHPAGGGGVTWVRNAGALSQHFRTYAIDTISETNKSVLTRPISIRRQRQEFAGWMTDLLDGLKVERTDLIGNSFGGFLALNTALYLPERVRKIVLISPAATFVPIPAWAWHFMPANAIGPIIGSKRMLLKPYEWIWQDFPREGSIYQLRTVTALTGRPRHWSPSVFSDEELRKIKAPVLLLIGDHEVIYKPQDAIKRATRLVTGLKAVIVPNANHIAEYTAAEFVNQQILGFLA
ncbi:MAG TPA: alpha/beta hydrolase [Anaerolineales bacterium]|nr:alpha/beta hydrolase [Anaerolineales bacterium]